VFFAVDESDGDDANSFVHMPEVSQPISQPPAAPVITITHPSLHTAAVVVAEEGSGSTMAVDMPDDTSIHNDPVPTTSRRLLKQGDHYYPNIWFDLYEPPTLEV
jgi:hypothetical protein